MFAVAPAVPPVTDGSGQDRHAAGAARGELLNARGLDHQGRQARQRQGRAVRTLEFLVFER